MTQTTTARRIDPALFGKTEKIRFVYVPEITTLLRYYAFTFSAEFGFDRAMDHITDLLDRMAPLIDLHSDPETDETTHMRRIRGIQEVLLIARGSHEPITKIGYMKGCMDNPMFCWMQSADTQCA